MTSEAADRLTERQWAILATLVGRARAATFDFAKPFLAVRVGLAGITIHHPAIDPISSDEMADVDHLADQGFLDLRRMPSGARSFTITEAGFERVERASENVHAQSRAESG